MAQKNDQVFQLSLTEIAFTIAFILLLLLGYLVVKEQTQRLAAEDALAQVQTAEQATTALNVAKSTLASDLQKSGASNPDDVITKLIAADEVRVERDRLKQQVMDLDAKLTALTELQKQLEDVAMSSRHDIALEEIESALTLQDQVRRAIDQDSIKPNLQAYPQMPAKEEKEAIGQDFTAKPTEIRLSSESNLTYINKQRNMDALARVKQAISLVAELKTQLEEHLGKKLQLGQEAQVVQELVAAAKSLNELTKNSGSPEALKKENSDLRGQVAFLKNRLDARGGRDYPPCWADESGKVEFLFSIEIRPDSVAVTRAWPPRREDAARDLPGLADALGTHSNRQFVSSIQGIFNWSRKQDPECRHYVQLKSSISDAVQSDRSRLMVENYFYKVETRR